MTDLEYETNYLENLLRLLRSNDDKTICGLVTAKGLCEVILNAKKEPFTILHQVAADTRAMIVDAIESEGWIPAAKKNPTFEELVLCIVKGENEGKPYHYYGLGSIIDWGGEWGVAYEMGAGHPVALEDVLYWRELPEMPAGLEDDDEGI